MEVKSKKEKVKGKEEERDYEQEIREYEEAIQERKYENRPQRKNIIYSRRDRRITEVFKAL